MSNTRAAVTQAALNWKFAPFYGLHLFGIGLLSGAHFHSWAVGLSVTFGLVILTFVPYVPFILSAFFSFCWAWVGYDALIAWSNGSVISGAVGAFIVFFIVYGFLIMGINFTRDSAPSHPD